jgi:hypothetical protein
VNDQETEKSALCSKKWSELPNGSKEEGKKMLKIRFKVNKTKQV